MHKIKKCQGEYSVWIMPEKEVYNRLSNLISNLSEKYNFPFFEPHVTLIGNLSGERDDLTAKCTGLASSINVDKIKLNKIDGFFENYFRSIFARAMKTCQIVDGNYKARKIFNSDNLKYVLPFDFDFMPHLSFAYGYFSPAIKEEIVSDIKKEFDITSKVDSILNLEFDVNNIHLYSITEKVEDWHEIGKFSLK